MSTLSGYPAYHPEMASSHEMPHGIMQAGFDRAFTKRLFWTAFLLHVVTVLLLMALGNGSIYEMSRDSYDYHVKSQVIAEGFLAGEINWGLWVDEGWFQFIGLVYMLFGAQMVLVLLINTILASCAAVLCYKIAGMAFDDESVARLSGLTLAWFPSAIYYTSLPLKEAPALFGALSVLYGIMIFRVGNKKGWWIWILCGLAIVASLRLYLCYVYSACTLFCLFPMRLTSGFSGLVRFGIVGAILAGGGLFLANAMGVDLSQYEAMRYFDIDYINKVRMGMNEGKTQLFKNRTDSQYSDNMLMNAYNLGMGFFYFFFSIDVTHVTRDRQLMALPEVFFFLYCFIYLIHGFWSGWKTRFHKVLPVFLFGTMIVLVYSSATTNKGTMYRWRVQALPFLIMVIVYGASVRQKGILYSLLQKFKCQLTPPLPFWNRPPVPVVTPYDEPQKRGDQS
ncbi:hypothetical protein MNBD_PLANCTO02-121 [hydrothermal vent metagenome]|uniref:Glycosyltransferase RgtA/B/C/D-like domain-containing protein n=1 Tax=hydrothermal vent metagenome TaxID=652676 RepID=A0A3B1E112_9ZZZZ